MKNKNEVKFETLHKVEAIILVISFLVMFFEGMILCSIGQIPMEFSKIPYVVFSVICIVVCFISLIRIEYFKSKNFLDKIIIFTCNPIGIAVFILASLIMAGIVCLIWGVISILITGLDG